MRKLIPVVTLLLALPSFAATAKKRAVALPHVPQVTLSVETVDAATGKPVVQVDIATPAGSVHEEGGNKATFSIPAGQSVALTFSRLGYEPLTEVVSATSDTTRTFRLTSKPTTLATTRSGKSYELDAGSLTFGYIEPFLGYKRSAEVKTCKEGGGELKLNNDNIAKLTGPAFTQTQLSCCPTGTPTGLQVELTTGEKVRTYFTEFCENHQEEIIARDHITWELVFIPVTDLAELTVRSR